MLDRRTGELVVGRAGSEPMYAASLAKLIVVVDVLDGGGAGPPVRGLVRRMLGPSDDAAMNEFWTRFGGAEAVRSVADRLGLHETPPPRRTGWWGETMTSARDIVAVYRYVLNDMSPAHRELIVQALANAPERAADGFDQNIGLMAAGGWAAKTAWACCWQGRVWTHSLGRSGERYVVALLAHEPGSYGLDRAGADLTEVAEVAVRPLR